MLRPTRLPSTPTPSPLDSTTTETVVREAVSMATVAVAVAVALGAALLVAEALRLAFRVAGRGRPVTAHLAHRTRRPVRGLLAVTASWLAVRIAVDDPWWLEAVEHGLLIATIVTALWVVGSLAYVAEDRAIDRFRVAADGDRHARRIRTQMMVVRRLTVALLALCAVAGALLTFDGARAAGAGLLASAGVLSVVAGMAAQTTLASVFAGLQLAFTDAIRVDDVVVVEGEWGRIEEVTMTYVVVHLWDDRRLILPSTWFTTSPFQNWTRTGSDILGTVELDLDWRAPVPAMRAEVTRMLAASDLWDERVGVLQVTDATDDRVRARVMVSAVDAPTLWDLRCHIREGLVRWLQVHHPHALPRTRFEHTGPAPRAAEPDAALAAPDSSTTGPAGARADHGSTADAGSTVDPAPAPFPRPRTPGATEVLPRVPADGGSTRAPAPTVRRRTVAQARLEHTSEHAAPLEHDAHASMFTGSIDALERARAFTGHTDADVSDDEPSLTPSAAPHR